MGIFGPAGMYGKVPAAGDFVRLRTGDPASRVFVRWLEAASEAMPRSAVLDAAFFLFCPVGAPQALLGAIKGSVDRVGRRYPLALFTPFDAARTEPRLASVPEAASGFLAGAAALLADAPALGLAELTARVEALPVTPDGALDQASGEAAARADRESGRALLERLFGEPAAGQRWYAVQCLRLACAAAVRDVRGAGVVLDCPATSDLDRWTWIELARRRLGGARAPSAFWRAGTPPRMMVAVGEGPEVVLALLAADGLAQSKKCWPLTTQHPAAIAAAQRAIGAEVQAALEQPELSVRALVEAVAPAGG